MSRLSPQAAAQAGDRFEELLSQSFAVLLPNADDFDLARTYLGNHESGLRAGDALHLAIARNHGADAIFSFDKGMIKAGEILGLPVSAGS